MDRNDFLNAVIDEGVMEIITTYTRPDQTLKKEGGIAGFELCRGKSDAEILALLDTAKAATRRAMDCDLVDYWSVVMRERQIEWTLNVLSARLYLEGQEVLVPTTARGLNKAVEILGLKALV